MRCVFTILVQIRCIKHSYVHVIIILELTNNISVASKGVNPGGDGGIYPPHVLTWGG